MSEELKYCKFCDKTKTKKEFCKSGGFIRNICRECNNEKQTKMYRDSKKVKKLENNWNELKKYVSEQMNYYSLCDDDYKEFNVLSGVEGKMQELEDSVCEK